MFSINNLYRWCDQYGGGLVIADSLEDAGEKLAKRYGDDREEFIIWEATNDDYYDDDYPLVFDIYGG